METNVNYTVVGAFVIAFVATIVVIVVWLSSGITGASYTYYKVFMQESVGGLSKDASVEFNGVQVGTVYKIKLNPNRPQMVELLLKVKKNTPITMGTRAKLDLRSFGGTTYMQLEDKGTDLRPIQVASGQEYPVILTTPSILVKFNTVLNHVSESFKQMSTTLQLLFDRENLASIKGALLNIRKFTDVLSQDTQEIDTSLKDISHISRSLKVETIPSAHRALSNFGNLSTDISGLSGEIKQNPAVIIRGRANPPLGPGEQ